ncbi:DciA family protein [Marinifilum sp.]|uniref:DciA family protein n=1 Tax=Marinifilum sp. TaxID=2033137 RepID=UPI003BAD245B
MRRSNTQKIDELIKQVLKESKLDVKLKEYELVNSWEKVIGKTVAKATTDIYIRNRRLFVAVRSSVIRNELMIIRDGLVKALNREVQANIIDEIVVR